MAIWGTKCPSILKLCDVKSMSSPLLFYANIPRLAFDEATKQGKGTSCPPKSPFPAKFIFHVFFHVYNLSTSTCTLDLPSSTCTLVLLRTTSHNTPIHNSTKIPTTEMILGDVESSSDIGSGNSSSCNTLPPSLPYFLREVFTAPITRQRQWRQRT